MKDVRRETDFEQFMERIGIHRPLSPEERRELQWRGMTGRLAGDEDHGQ